MLVLSSLLCQSSTLLAQVSRRARVSGTPWLFTSQSPLSSAYNAHASESFWRLFAHVTPCALALDFANTGSSRAARMAMMATTTRSSIKVKAKREGRDPRAEGRRAFCRSIVLSVLTRGRLETDDRSFVTDYSGVRP